MAAPTRGLSPSAIAELTRRRQSARTSQEVYQARVDIERAKRDPEFARLIADIAERPGGSYATVGHLLGRLGLGAASMAPFLMGGPVSAGIGLMGMLGGIGYGGLDILEGLKRREAGAGTGQIVGGAAEALLSPLGMTKALGALRGAKAVKALPQYDPSSLRPMAVQLQGWDPRVQLQLQRVREGQRMGRTLRPAEGGRVPGQSQAGGFRPTDPWMGVPVFPATLRRSGAYTPTTTLGGGAVPPRTTVPPSGPPLTSAFGRTARGAPTGQRAPGWDPRVPAPAPPVAPVVSTAPVRPPIARPAASAAAAASGAAYTLPAALARAAPRYRNATLAFESDLDKALYIVRNKKTRSAADEKFMASLRKQFPGESDDAIRAKGDAVNARLKGLTPDDTGNIVVPHTAGAAARASRAAVPQPLPSPPTPAAATGAPVQPGPSVFNIMDDIGAGYASGKTAAGRPLKNIALRLASLGWARRAVENLDPKALQALSRGEETGLSQQFWGGLTGEKAGLGGARLFGHRDVALGRPVRGASRTAFTALEGGLPSRNVVERFLEGARQTEYGNEGKEALALLNRWIKEDTAAGKNIAKMTGFRNRAGNLVVDVRTTVKNVGGRTDQYLPAKQAQSYVVIRERARVLREILETIVKGRKGVELKEFGRGRALGVGEETLEAGVDQFLRLGSATDRKKLLDAMNEHAQQIAILVASIMGAQQLLPQGGARAAGG